MPVGRQQMRLVGDGVDIVGEAERDYVGFETVDDGAGLFARTAVGEIEVTSCPVLAFQYFANAAS